MTQAQLQELLDSRVEHYNRPDFIESDPISIPHRFSKKEDIEIAGFLAATIAWGQRPTIIRNALQLMEWMNEAPHDFILHATEKDLSPFYDFKHRTFNGEDCVFFLTTLQNIYRHHGGLEDAFSSHISKEDTTVFKGITGFRNLFFSLDHLPRTRKHVSEPANKSAAKRLNMYLRWMVRNDNKGVDFGLWKKINPAQLCCPLDVHSGRTARHLKLLKRKASDWQAVEELTTSLKKFDPEDPVKYDFALFGLGVFEKLGQ